MAFTLNINLDVSPRLWSALRNVQDQLENIVTQNDRILADVEAFKTALARHAVKVQKQLQQVIDLIAQQGQPSPEVSAALTELETGINQLTDLDTALDADDQPAKP